MSLLKALSDILRVGRPHAQKIDKLEFTPSAALAEQYRRPQRTSLGPVDGRPWRSPQRRRTAAHHHHFAYAVVMYNRAKMGRRSGTRMRLGDDHFSALGLLVFEEAPSEPSERAFDDLIRDI